MRSAEKAVIKTLVYSNIFKFPLSYDELWRFLISPKPVSKKLLTETLNNKSQNFTVKNGWHYLSYRERLIDIRLQRSNESSKKLTDAKKIVLYLSLVPTVYLVGISGALAMKNAGEQDDIDLFVITKSNTIWITRLILTLILQVFGARRNRSTKHAANTVCLNMFIDESVMAFPINRRDLYTAHEIVQMKPLFDRGNTYQKFLGANLWVKEFLPNSIDTKILRYKDIKKKKLLSILVSQYLNIFLVFFEFIAKTIQLWYMKGHKTNETVNDHLLAFHPLDYKEIVLKEYKKRLKKIIGNHEKI